MSGSGVRRHAFLGAAVGGAVLVVLLVPPARHTVGRGLVLLAAGQLEQFRQFLLGLGAWAPAVSIGLMVVEALAVPVPIALLMVANGLAFGVWRGLLVSLAGGMLGAATAYVLARAFGRPLVERILPAAGLKTADRLMARYGGWAVVLERWIPGVPCDPVSYAAGLTRMAAWRFFGLTLLGLIPANLATAWFGAEIATDVPLPYWFGGLAGVAVIAWMVWRRRSRRPPASE